jgi:hypothetical protein
MDLRLALDKAIGTAALNEHSALPLPHVSRRTRRLLGPVNGLLVNG